MLTRFRRNRKSEPGEQRLLMDLRRLLDCNEGLHVSVVGSRPDADMSDPRLLESSLLISANAAASRTLQTPNLAILDYRHVRPAISHLTGISQQLLSQLQFETVLAVQSNTTEATYSFPSWLKCQRLLDCDLSTRGAIVRRAVGLQHFPVDADFLVSTGVFAACLATLLGAKSLHLHAFSLYAPHPRTMHFYDEDDSDWEIGTEARPHSRADAATLSLLSRRVPMTSDSWDISGLLRNWPEPAR